MGQRDRDHVGAGVEMAVTELRDLLREQAEGLEVRAGLPRRVDRRVEGMHERVHVRRGQVVLLVPGGRREHEVRKQGRGGHAEIEGGEQVELAVLGVLPPHHVPPAMALGCLVGTQRRVGAQQVLEEVLVALGRRAQQVRAPHRQDLGRVAGPVRVLGREPHRAVLDPAHHMLGRGDPGRGGLVAEIERVLRERGERGHPAQTRRHGHQVRGAHPGEAVLARRRGEGVRAVRVVLPLPGVQVEERGRDHLPRRPRPVQTHRDLLEAGQRADLLLADVVGPAATVDALRPGEDGQREERPVDQVRVEPVVGARTHEDHRPAAGLQGVLRELATDLLGLLRRYARVFLLPGRGVGMRVVVTGRPLTGKALAGHTELGHHQIEHRGDADVDRVVVVVPSLDGPEGHPAGDRAGLAPRGVEPWQDHLGGPVPAVQHRQ